MSNEKSIKPAGDNHQKQETYRVFTSKHKSAMNNGFYFEALLIDYAMMEDRINAFLYHIGVNDDRNVMKVCGRNKKQLKQIYAFSGVDTGNGIRVDTLSSKIKLIEFVIKWADESVGELDDRYLHVLKDTLNGDLDTEYILNILRRLNVWKEYRNEVIHGLLNKNIYSVFDEISEKAEEGMMLARELDSQVRLLRNNKIRRAVKMKAN